MEEFSRCSLCKNEFGDVVKLVAECGGSLCERCYEDLKVDADEADGRFKCPVCQDEHIMPPSGLPDNKALLNLIRSLPKKPMPESARELEKQVRELMEQIEKLQAFDGAELVELRCQQLELEIQGGFASAVDHLRKVEAKLLKEISAYKERCLQNLSAQANKPGHGDRELARLTREIGGFNAKWNNYFKNIDVYESESDIEAARTKAAEFSSTIESTEKRLSRDAFDQKRAVFTLNTQFWTIWDHFGLVEILNETEAPQLNSFKPKKISIGESPSLTLTGHSAAVNHVIFVPGDRLVSCSDDQTIKIWDVTSGQELSTLVGHSDWVYTAAIWPDGRLVSGCKDGTIKFWNLAQKRELVSIKAHSSRVLSLRVLMNQTMISYSMDNKMIIWNLSRAGLKPVFTLEGHGNVSLDVPLFGVLSSRYIVTCSTSEDDKDVCMLRVWTLGAAAPNKSFPVSVSRVRSLLVLANGHVAIGGVSGRIEIYDVAQEALLTVKEFVPPILHISLSVLSNDDMISAAVSSRSVDINVWSLPDWSLVQTIATSHSDRINSLCVSVDERFLAGGSQDGTIKLWPIISE